MLALSVLLLVGAALILVLEPVTGPHLAHLWEGHGLEAGDLLALPVLAAAAFAAWHG